MNIYDKIGGEYDTHRGDIGTRDVLELVCQMGDGLHVLDLGCGTGHPIAMRIAPLVSRYLGIDNSEAMLSAFRQNVPEAECACLDMTRIEGVGGGWDVIFSWGAMCHLPVAQQTTSLVAAVRLLNTGGRLMFTSGPEPGRCKGSVGPHINVIDHFSMGQVGYTELLTAHGMTMVWAEPREAGNFTYLYEKVSNNGVHSISLSRADASSRNE